MTLVTAIGLYINHSLARYYIQSALQVGVIWAFNEHYYIEPVGGEEGGASEASGQHIVYQTDDTAVLRKHGPDFKGG